MTAWRAFLGGGAVALAVLAGTPASAQGFCASDTEYWPKPPEGCAAGIELAPRLGGEGFCSDGGSGSPAECWVFSGRWMGLAPRRGERAPPARDKSAEPDWRRKQP